MMKTREVDLKPWQLGLAGLGVIALVIYAGFRSSGEHGGIADTQAMEEYQQHRSTNSVRSSSSVQSKVKIYQEEPAAGGGSGHGSYQKVMKLIQEGVIKRINEPNRELYVNDPVWKVTTHERRAYTIRAVAEYLDGVSDNPTGKVEVRSYRNGRRLAGMNLEPEAVEQ